MRDITEIFDHYRIAARSIWNMAFWSEPELRNWDSWDQFERIKELLFKALVLARLGAENGSTEPQASAARIFYVAPRGSVPVMISKPRAGDSNWYWDDPVRQIDASDAELHFLDYFDWDKMGYADFQYYRVRIAAFRAHPDLIGRDALIERINATVLVMDTEWIPM